MMLKRSFLFAAIALVVVPLLLGGAGDGSWMASVPAKARQKRSPLLDDPRSVAAGAKLFGQNCSQCHGSEAMGMDKRPNLHSDRIRRATPGELEWLITNGSLKNGMPAWSQLPEPQRWQLVAFLKSLK